MPAGPYGIRGLLWERIVVEEPVKLVCPECELVYRVKKLTPGKDYKCRKCGGELRPFDADASPSDADYEARIANENLAAASATDIIPAKEKSAPESASRRGGLSPESDLARLPRLIEDLTARLDLLRNVGIGDGCEPADTAGKLLEITDSLSRSLGALNAELTRDFQDLDLKVSGLLEKIAGDEVSVLAEQVKETGGFFLARLEEYHEAQKTELAALLAPREEENAGTTVEVNIDELADRLVAGVRGRSPLFDSETSSAVDALARVADELVREQSSNTSRLDSLASEIKGAVSGIEKLEEWRGDLPLRVAEDIGRMVEEQVVGPVSSALSRQAPAILSELQDNKLVDIVSRSVREAQRPLLREILTGKRGVPTWIFISVLFPLIAVIGFFLFPGVFGWDDTSTTMKNISEDVYSMRNEGIPFPPEIEEQLRGIEYNLLEIKDKAGAHAANAAALEHQVKTLEAEIKTNERCLVEYEETVKAQFKRLQAYEARLIQLGVTPKSIQ